MQICPCCKRKLPQPKTDAPRKALMHDLSLAENAIDALQSALHWPHESESFREAVQLELVRMRRALDDHGLLWRIYRRNSKTPSYATMPNIQTERAA